MINCENCEIYNMAIKIKESELFDKLYDLKLKSIYNTKEVNEENTLRFINTLSDFEVETLTHTSIYYYHSNGNKIEVKIFNRNFFRLSLTDDDGKIIKQSKLMPIKQLYKYIDEIEVPPTTVVMEAISSALYSMDAISRVIYRVI